MAYTKGQILERRQRAYEDTPPRIEIVDTTDTGLIIRVLSCEDSDQERQQQRFTFDEVERGEWNEVADGI